ncbi:hypothetical protein ACQPYK_49805 (plasmid) [Streptosporangium sp. CA-135522]|uniref:hypothetical protein n=1 Tax=Streptosporangium sp. CA-135522 TaxID=3240072 RepID=UPI003D8C8152
MSLSERPIHNLADQVPEEIGNELIDLVSEYRQTPLGVNRMVLAHQVADLADRYLVDPPACCFAIVSVAGEAVDGTGARMHFARAEGARRRLASVIEARPQDAPYRIVRRDRPCYVADCAGCGEIDASADDGGMWVGHHDTQAAADEAASRHWVRTWDGRLLCRGCAAAEFAPDARRPASPDGHRIPPCHSSPFYWRRLMAFFHRHSWTPTAGMHTRRAAGNNSDVTAILRRKRRRARQRALAVAPLPA